jgi:hypothetical protein
MWTEGEHDATSRGSIKGGVAQSLQWGDKEGSGTERLPRLGVRGITGAVVRVDPRAGVRPARHARWACTVCARVTE